MSCTVVLVPMVIGPQLITALISSLTLSVAATAYEHKKFLEDNNNIKHNAEDFFVVDAMRKAHHNQQQICSQYKTIFKDAELLKKTLREHEVTDITEMDGKIYGNLKTLKFEFSKGEEGLYDMHIVHDENADMGVVDELNNEYQMNVQEESYNKIKKNLEAQNLQVSTEEVLEDNSIILTVNLE